MKDQHDAPIIIIGSGFAAYQLIRAIRRSDPITAIHVFTADKGDDYNKPDLSHVFSKQQLASDLVRIAGSELAIELNFELHANTYVEEIVPSLQQICAAGKAYHYAKLVLATGASTVIPPMSGSAVDRVLTLNSLQEFQACQQELHQAERILVIGAGLIGVELSMDLASAGKQVITVDACDQLMANLLPEYIANQLAKQMQPLGVQLVLSNTVSRIDYCANSAIIENSEINTPSLNHTLDLNYGGELQVELASGDTFRVDHVLCAAGLKPNTQLAKQAGLALNRGIVVDDYLQTSASDVFAIGDCAEINGQVLAYLQPALLSANALAKTLLGQATPLVLPAMLVKVKTPHYPIQLSGNAVKDVSRWQLDVDANGCSVKAFNTNGELQGFVVAKEHMASAFTLLKSLTTSLV
ncbi:NADH:flavorubredoxin reductase NorW [Shewanella sp. 125m-7]